MVNLPLRLRSLRLRQKRTLKDIASQCGFTVSLLSKIESGKTTPPLATLTKIAAALGISLANLLEGKGHESTILTSHAELSHKPPTTTDKGYSFHLLAAARGDKLMQPFLMIAERGKVKPGPLSHGGEEFIYVLEGQMRYRVGETTYTLGPGDSLYFNSDEEHDLEPLTKTVRFLAVFTEHSK